MTIEFSMKNTVGQYIIKFQNSAIIHISNTILASLGLEGLRFRLSLEDHKSVWNLLSLDFENCNVII